MFSAAGPINSFSPTKFVIPPPANIVSNTGLPFTTVPYQLRYASSSDTLFAFSEAGTIYRELNLDGTIADTVTYTETARGRVVYESTTDSMYYQEKSGTTNNFFIYDVTNNTFVTKTTGFGSTNHLGGVFVPPTSTYCSDPTGCILLFDLNDATCRKYDINGDSFADAGDTSSSSRSPSVYNPVSDNVFTSRSEDLFRWDGVSGTTAWTKTVDEFTALNIIESDLIVVPSGKMYHLVYEFGVDNVQLFSFNSSGGSPSLVNSWTTADIRPLGMVYSVPWNLVIILLFDNTTGGSLRWYYFNPDDEVINTGPTVLHGQGTLGTGDVIELMEAHPTKREVYAVYDGDFYKLTD